MNILSTCTYNKSHYCKCSILNTSVSSFIRNIYLKKSSFWFAILYICTLYIDISKKILHKCKKKSDKKHMQVFFKELNIASKFFSRQISSNCIKRLTWFHYIDTSYAMCSNKWAFGLLPDLPILYVPLILFVMHYLKPYRKHKPVSLRGHLIKYLYPQCFWHNCNVLYTMPEAKSWSGFTENRLPFTFFC